MGIHDELEDEGGARRRRRRKKMPRRTQHATARPAYSPQHVVMSAVADAQAHYSAEDNGRPNRLYGLHATDPTATIAAGATVSGEITLNDDSWIVWCSCIDEDAKNILMTSFKVNSFDVVGGGKPNLAAFLAYVNRKDRPTPLIGRKFNGNCKIAFTVQNITAAPVLFRGFTVLVNEPVCKNDVKNSTIAPGVLQFGTFMRQVQPVATKVARSPGMFGMVR